MKHASVALACAVLGGTGLWLAQPVGSRAEPTGHSAARHGWSQLALAARGAVSGALGQGDRVFAVRRRGGGLVASNPPQQLQLDVRGGDVLVRSGPERLGLSLLGVGRRSELLPALLVRTASTANRIVLERGDVQEWYVNGPYGVEQGFTLAQRPLASASGPLALAVSVDGDLRPALAGPRALTLDGPHGAVLRYSGLSVTDRRGRAMRAWLTVRRRTILISVDDRGAVYPIRVDPYIQLAKLTGASAEALDGQVAISGNTVAIGDTGTGSVLVYQRPAAGWGNSSAPTAVLTSFEANLRGELFPTSVAIAGNTIVVGARNSSGSGPGHGYVFVEPPGGWASTSISSVTLTEPVPNDMNDDFGFSVAISRDAGTIVVGAPNYAGHGAGFVFTTPFTGSPAELDDGTPSGIGESVATIGSATVVAGSGRAFVFVEPFGGWATTHAPGASLGTDIDQTFSGFGAAASMTPDTIVIADPAHGGFGSLTGSVYVYVQHGGRWVSEAEDATLSASDGATFGQNFSVAISGNTIAAGAPFEPVGGNGQQGVVFLFTKGPGNWTSGTQTDTVVAADGQSCDHLGWSVAISGGQLAASNQTGNCHSSNGPGAVYVFGSVPTTSIALSPQTPNGRNGWYVSPVNVSVSAVDDAGVSATRCVLDAASPPAGFSAIAAGCPFAGAGSAVTGDGQHAVYAASLNVLGISEPPKSASFKIDATPPTVTCSPPPSFALHGQGGLVAANIADATSGPAQPTVAVPADVSTAGHKTVTLTGFDNAGNATTVQCPYVVLAPRIDARLNWTANQFSAFTVLTQLNVAHVPSGAQIAIACRGGGCPFRLHTVHVPTSRLVCKPHHKHCKRKPAPALSNVNILAPLAGRHLAVATKLTITATAPQTVGEVWTLTIRSAKAPHETGPTCLAPGSRKPGRGC